MTERKPPAPPRSAGPSGRKLWRSVVADYELDQHEYLLLREAVRTADLLDRLAAEIDGGPLVVEDGKGKQVTNPAIIEARQQKIVLARLLASLRLPSGEESGELQRPQRRGAARRPYLRRVQ